MEKAMPVYEGHLWGMLAVTHNLCVRLWVLGNNFFPAFMENRDKEGRKS